MAVKFRNHCNISGFAKDYNKIRTFLCTLSNPNYSFGRWDWMMKHGYPDEFDLSKIGLWEEENEIVAIAIYDSDLGNGHFCVKESYEYLKRDMLIYSKEYLSKGGKYLAMINDMDTDFQNIAFEMGFIPTQEKECDAYVPISESSLVYDLPVGFQITSMKKNYDTYKYGEVLWKGFDHEADGEGVFRPSEEEMKNYDAEFHGPNVNPNLKIAVMNPEGNFVSYCGMWYDQSAAYAIVEPVATDPRYRRLGLGKAAVLEGIKQCGLLGAKTAYVGSSQQFYYKIGFRPYATSTWWEERRIP